MLLSGGEQPQLATPAFFHLEGGVVLHRWAGGVFAPPVLSICCPATGWWGARTQLAKDKTGEFNTLELLAFQNLV